MAATPSSRLRMLFMNVLPLRICAPPAFLPAGLFIAGWPFKTSAPAESEAIITMRTEQARPVRLDQYRPPDWLVETVGIGVSLHSTATKVRATLKMSPNLQTAPAPIVLDGDGLTLTSVKLDGQLMRPDGYIATPDSLTIPQPPAGTCYLQIETLVNPSANTQLMGLYRSSGSYCTQCEAEGFRRITYFPDRPDVMAVYTTRIEAEKSEAAVLLSNGNPVESGDVTGTTRHFAIWHDPFPKPAYLFALVGGNLAHVEDT